MTKGVEVITKEFTIVVGVPSDRSRGVVREVGFKVMKFRHTCTSALDLERRKYTCSMLVCASTIFSM